MVFLSLFTPPSPEEYLQLISKERSVFQARHHIVIKNKSNLRKQKKSVHTEIQTWGDWTENEMLLEARSGSNVTFTQSFPAAE